MGEEKVKSLLNTIIKHQDGTTEDIEMCNKCVEQLENILPFKNEDEHKEWLDTLFSYKFFEDFEEITLRIAMGESNMEEKRSIYEKDVENLHFILQELYYYIDTDSVDKYYKDTIDRCIDMLKLQDGKLVFNGEELILDRVTECDFCGEKKVCGITHYGTTNYNRLICGDCVRKIKKYHENIYGEEI